MGVLIEIAVPQVAKTDRRGDLPNLPLGAGEEMDVGVGIIQFDDVQVVLFFGQGDLELLRPLGRATPNDPEQ